MPVLQLRGIECGQSRRQQLNAVGVERPVVQHWPALSQQRSESIADTVLDDVLGGAADQRDGAALAQQPAHADPADQPAAEQLVQFAQQSVLGQQSDRQPQLHAHATAAAAVVIVHYDSISLQPDAGHVHRPTDPDGVLVARVRPAPPPGLRGDRLRVDGRPAPLAAARPAAAGRPFLGVRAPDPAHAQPQLRVRVRRQRGRHRRRLRPPPIVRSPAPGCGRGLLVQPPDV